MKKVISLLLAAILAVGCTAVALADDGTFTGTAKGFGGDITAEITVEGGKIAAVKLTGAGETPAIGGAALETLEGKIVEANGADFDAVAGATFTSNGVREAVAEALNAANGASAAEVSGFNAGTYTAIVPGHNSDFEIYVTFSADKLEAIEIGEHFENHSVGDRAMLDIAEVMIANQTLNVDALAGATVTSKGFVYAVTDAVRQAGGDPKAMQTPVEKDTTTPADMTVDVVVVGAGGAGLGATVEAWEQGLNVVLVEQLGILGGASGRAGYIMAAGTEVLAEQGIDFSVEDLLNAYKITNELTVAFENQTSQDVNWLKGIGVPFGPVNLNNQHYGPNGARVGGYFTEAMRAYMDANNIDYRLNTRAEKLLTDENGKVCGVVVTAPNGENYTIAADAVILATGGFFANTEMTEEYIPGFGSNPFDCGIGADGSGMKMAEAVGAELVGMDYANFHAIAGFFRGASRSLTLVAGNGGIAVNSKGERFFNEAGDYTQFTMAAMQQDAVYAIMDQQIADLDVIKNDVGCAATWGMYTVCDTLDEVAVAMNIDAEGLKKTIADYQASITAGGDEFGKAVANMRTDFTHAPYYVVPTLVENHTTYGGIKTADNTQALTAEGEVVKGLYAAGECTQKKSYMLGNFGAAIYEGRTAVRTYLENK